MSGIIGQHRGGRGRWRGRGRGWRGRGRGCWRSGRGRRGGGGLTEREIILIEAMKLFTKN